MKIQIRQGVFETNSSSVHSLTICSKSEYELWKKGALLYDRWNDKLVLKTNDMNSDEYHQTYEQFWSNYDFENFKYDYITKGGEEVVAFGYYGHD